MLIAFKWRSMWYVFNSIFNQITKKKLLKFEKHTHTSMGKLFKLATTKLPKTMNHRQGACDL